jgi:hypothetical protein
MSVGDICTPRLRQQFPCLGKTYQYHNRPGTGSLGCQFPGLRVQGLLLTTSMNSRFILDFTHLEFPLSAASTSTSLQYNIYGLQIFQAALLTIQNERVHGAVQVRAIDRIQKCPAEPNAR